MASNIAQNTIPSLWSSANDDIIYNFSFNPYAIDSVTDDGGNASINLQLDFDVTPVPGEYIYILSNVYIGTFKILSVTGTSVVTIDTAYISTITSNLYNCYHLRVPVFSLYKGFTNTDPLIGSDLLSSLPYTKVVDIKPSVLYYTSGIPYIEIDISAIAINLFDILPNTVANSIDTSMFSPIRFLWDGEVTEKSTFIPYTLALNSALSNSDLNERFTGDGFYLTPIDKPLIDTSGVTFASYINASIFPVVHKFINGVKQ